MYALGARTGEFTPAVLNRLDIVGFDPRGVGGSLPALHCVTGSQLDRYLAVNEAPASPAQLAAVIAANKGFAQDCARNARALLPYVGTESSARDMDILRAALGESRLTYLGKSYGTVLGASYAQQFPSRVRALVLDGAVAPGLSGTDLDITQAQGFSVAFGQFVAWCTAQATCPLPADLPGGHREGLRSGHRGERPAAGQPVLQAARRRRDGAAGHSGGHVHQDGVALPARRAGGRVQ